MSREGESAIKEIKKKKANITQAIKKATTTQAAAAKFKEGIKPRIAPVASK